MQKDEENISFDDLERFTYKYYRPKTKGKDGRYLSEFQQKPWMIKIGNRRKYLNPPKGEKNGNAKLNEFAVLNLREAPAEKRIECCYWAQISERQWYKIRAKKAWKHI